MKQERLVKAEAISKKIISEYIITELQDFTYEYGIVTITDVKISNDLGYIDVFVSSLKNSDTLTKELSEYAHILHRTLARKIDFLKTPKIRFRYDETGRSSHDIYNTIKSL